MIQTSIENKDLVYGMAGGWLVCMPRERAEELAAAHEALRTATTWGEFRDRVASEIFEEAVEYVVDEDDEPDEDAAFDAEEIGAYNDGDWPAWPAQEMLDWVPRAIQKEFGTRSTSTLGQSFLEFDADRTDAIVEAFRTQGYTCTRDDDLVTAASAA